MRRKSYWLSLLALVLIVTAAIPPALAYLTGNKRATGTAAVSVGTSTTIEENEPSGTEKNVTIRNTGDNPVYVRAIVYAGENVTLEISGWGSGASAGSWIYYADPIPAGDTAPVLTVKVTDVTAYEGYVTDSFNVVVQYESVPVLYRADGTPYADWNSTWILDTGSVSP